MLIMFGPLQGIEAKQATIYIKFPQEMSGQTNITRGA